jgi:hypothetical protein
MTSTERGQNRLSESGSIHQNRPEQNQGVRWSGQQDSNLRPAVPKTAALPGCAIPRGTRGRPFDTCFAVCQQGGVPLPQSGRSNLPY